MGTPKTLLRKYEKQLLASDWSVVHEGLEVKLCPDPDGGSETVDVILPTRCGQRIRKRCVGKPTEHQAILLQKLGLSLPRSLEVVDL